VVEKAADEGGEKLAFCSERAHGQVAIPWHFLPDLADQYATRQPPFFTDDDLIYYFCYAYSQWSTVCRIPVSHMTYLEKGKNVSLMSNQIRYNY
jgi:hypothetical protein